MTNSIVVNHTWATADGIESGKPTVDTKVWGKEWIYTRDPHACKAMVLEPKMQVSIHYHAVKSETFVLISGKLIVETFAQNGEKHKTMLSNAYDAITIMPFVAHTFYCPDDQAGPTIFIEASTRDNPHDSFRLSKSGRRTEEDSINR